MTNEEMASSKYKFFRDETRASLIDHMINQIQQSDDYQLLILATAMLGRDDDYVTTFRNVLKSCYKNLPED